MENKLYWRLSLLQFTQLLIWGTWFVTTGTYLNETLGFSGREVGLVYGTSAIAASLSPFILGVLADRLFAAERLLAILHLCGSGLLLAMSFATGFGWFYTLVLLNMLCYLPTFALANSLCFHHLPDAKKHFPRVRVWGSISWILIGFVLSAMQVEAQATPLRIAAAFSLVHAVYCLTLPHTPPAKRQGETFLQALRSPAIKALFQDRSFMVMLLSIGLICIPSAYYYSFVNPFLNEAGVANAAAKMTLAQFSEVLFMLALPWFFRQWRLKYIIFAGLFCWGIRYALFILGYAQQADAWYYIALFLHGPAFILSGLSAQIYLDTLVPAHLRSTAQGFFSFLTLGLGALIGSVIAGETVTAFTLPSGLHEWEYIWLWPTVAGLLTAVFFLLFFKARNKAFS